MVRGRKLRRIALSVVCACAALAVAAPATASAQSGVDEYTLDIPGSGGSGSSDQGSPPSAGAAGSGDGGGSTRGEGAEGGRGGGVGSEAAARGGDDAAGSGDSGASSANAPLPPTDSRSAPEVVADTLFDGAMLPLLGALVAITGVGAWRLVRHRRTLTGTAG